MSVRSVTVVLNASTDGEHDGPYGALVTATADYLARLRREIEQAKAMKVTDQDLVGVLHADRRVVWLEHSELVSELGEVTGFDDDSGGWAVVPAELDERLSATLDQADSGQEYRSELDTRRTDEHEVYWTGYPKHGDFGFLTASLSAAALAELAAQLGT
jgi:hypothetical protein